LPTFFPGSLLPGVAALPETSGRIVRCVGPRSFFVPAISRMRDSLRNVQYDRTFPAKRQRPATTIQEKTSATGRRATF
jgi:hypothetical protein